MINLEIGYKFTNFEKLTYHSSKWWYNGVEVKQVVNNGSLSLLIAGVKYGKVKFLKARRKDAVKCEIADDCPF